MIGRDGGLSTLCVIAAGCSFTCHKRVCKKHFLTLAISGYLLYIYNHPNKSPCIPWHLQLQVSRFCDHQVNKCSLLQEYSFQKDKLMKAGCQNIFKMLIHFEYIYTHTYIYISKGLLYKRYRRLLIYRLYIYIYIYVYIYIYTTYVQLFNIILRIFRHL